MSLFTRREILASSLFSAIAPKAIAGLALPDVFPGERLLPTLWWSESSEAHVELGDLLPTPAVIERFDDLLREARTSRRTIVHGTGRFAPLDGYDLRLSEWTEVFERSGVNEVVETSDRSRQVTPPLRVGQIDPAGIVYRINEIH